MCADAVVVAAAAAEQFARAQDRLQRLADRLPYLDAAGRIRALLRRCDSNAWYDIVLADHIAQLRDTLPQVYTGKTYDNDNEAWTCPLCLCGTEYTHIEGHVFTAVAIVGNETTAHSHACALSAFSDGGGGGGGCHIECLAKMIMSRPNTMAMSCPMCRISVPVADSWIIIRT